MRIPIAKRIASSFTMHGQTIEDHYAWLRDTNWPNVNNPEILDYLKQENEYFENFFQTSKSEERNLFEELKSRIQLKDRSAYVTKDQYNYYIRTEEVKEYPIYCRILRSNTSREEILLDVNELALGRKFTQIGAFSISPNHKLMAYSVDFAGDERYEIKIYDLENGAYLNDAIANTIGDIVWHEHINGFFYTPSNENFRHDKVLFHIIGTQTFNDQLIFHEPDPLYCVNVSKSSDKSYIFINVSGHDTNEIYIISSSAIDFTVTLFKNRIDGIFYDIEHHEKNFYIYTNYKAKNFHIAIVAADAINKEWQDYIKEEESKYLTHFDVTQDYMILNYKSLGLAEIKIKRFIDGKEQIITFPDEAFVANASSSNFIENDIRISYASPCRPHITYLYDFTQNKLSILKIQEIPSGFTSSEYQVERIFTDNEGIQVPITIMYKKSLFKKDGTNPLYLYGYGSYGIAIGASFSNSAISLVNRGFVYAIAHIRGGDDLGYDWYESAKFLNKKRTFADFIAVTEELIKQKYSDKGNIIICGGSAGGLLLGNVINERPELFKAAIAHVPFVDVLNTMLDETLPLTPGEFKEWGDPKESLYFDYIKSYSPYDNIKAQNYPILMVIAGLSDPRVGYWEAAKWVARLRNTKTDDNMIIFKTNMDFGHKGASSRFDYLKEAACDLTFIFKIFDIKVK